MNKERFDELWKIAIIIILIVSLAYMFYQFNNLNKDGLVCVKAPFDYGLQKAEKANISCTFYCNDAQHDLKEQG